uniref:Uncharacterized protein n=1 Tax=Setaria digitata TaxID=48799 RepID=A0A915PP78_9BILA
MNQLDVLIFTQSLSSVLMQLERLGETVELELGAGVLDVQAAIPGAGDGQVDRRDILKNGKITKYGRQRYGNRLSFKNGTLTIQNLKAADAVTYFYHFRGDPRKPMGIDVVVKE